MLILISLLVMLSFTAIYRISAVPPTITIGVVGPDPLAEWTPGGMKEGAELAQLEINGAGGINIGGTPYTISLVLANEWAYDPGTGTYDITKAHASMATLLANSPAIQFIVGGFRTETTRAAVIEDTMDYNAGHSGSEIPLFICGAATEANDTGDPNVWYLCQNLTNPTTYARYKWVFRATPVNGTVLVRSLIYYLGQYLFPKKILPMYGTPVKYGVLMEDLRWCDAIYYTMNIPNLFYPFLNPYGGNAVVGYAARVPTSTTDFTSYLNSLEAANVHVIVTSFTLPMAETLVSQIKSQGRHMMVVGINTPAQEKDHWSRTNNGDCEYEVISNYAGYVPSFPDGYPPKMVAFWNHFMGNYSNNWPMYTAQGAYDAIYGIKEALETAGAGWTPTGLLPTLLAGRNALTGVIRYDAFQDLYSHAAEYTITWMNTTGTGIASTASPGYARNDLVQWISGSKVSPPVTGGIMTIVDLVNQLYSRKTQIPPAMYSLSLWDVNFDGIVDMMDISTAARGFMAVPGQTQYNIEADVNLDGIIDMMDISAMAMRFMQTAPTWPLP